MNPLLEKIQDDDSSSSSCSSSSSNPLLTADDLQCLYGQPQLIRIAFYDPHLAISLKTLIDHLEEGDFTIAHKTAAIVRARVWKLRCATRNPVAADVSRLSNERAES